MGKYLVGINTATAGTTVSIFNTLGQRVASSFSESHYYYASPGEVETTEEDVLDTVYKACQGALKAAAIKPDEIIAVAFATQSNVFCMLDKDERVIRNLIGWQDVRAAKSIDLNNYINAEELYDIAMVSDELSPTNYLLKLLWMQQNEPENYEKTAMFASQQDFMLSRFGVDGHLADISSIARQSMVDVVARKYSDLVFDKLQLDRNHYPTIVDTATLVGRISKEASEKSGLPEGVPLCLGAHNQSANQIGVGAVHPGDHHVLFSTMGASTIVCENPLRDPQRLMTVKPNPGFDHWSLDGLALCTTGGIKWLRDVFGYAANTQDNATNTIMKEVQKSCPGAKGVTFIPYLQGSFGVNQNPNASGAFVGMTAGTTRSDIARAVLEGITYEVYDILESQRTVGVTTNNVRISGQAENYPTWCQIIADILQTPVEITNNHDAGAMGAAMIAGVGAGVFNNLYEAVEQYVHVAKVYEPNPKMAPIYEEGFEKYLSIVEGLEMTRIY